MNYWHEIEPKRNGDINVIVEIPRGSKNKYEIDKQTGLIALDRAAHTAQDFPFDYGFIPQTLWDDDDPVDVVLLTSFPLHPGILVRVRPIALLRMVDDGDADDKVIAVPTDDPRWSDTTDLSDINPHTLREMEHFYSTYKKLQDKAVEVSGFEGKEAAVEAVERGITLYRENYREKFSS